MSFPKILLPLLAVLAVSAGIYFYLQPSKKKKEADIKMEVRKGEFRIKVAATGELNAKRSVKIRGPQGMRAAGIYETTISDLVTEGSILREGDYVATLDRTELAGKMSNVQTEIEKIQTQLEQARIDTAIELRGLRDELVNLEFSKKEKLLLVEQSRFEPQSVIQQAQLDLERTERDFKQLQKKYELKQQQSVAKIQEINALLRQNQMQLGIYTELSDGFTIKAPEDGMLIYSRTWNGKKEPGSRVSAWDPVVAELPDLSDMISKTYVNEVDISKVQEGQEVRIKVDAFPDNEYAGKVIQVANIGEQLRGYDAKVFEVVVQVLEGDSILRPAMTTSNEIITEVFDEVLYIPLEGLQSDSLTYVFKEKNGRIVRQEIITSLSNDDEIIVEHGLEEGDLVYLTVPEGDFPFVPVDEEIKESIRKKQEEEARKRQAQAMQRKKSIEDIERPSPSSGGGDVIIVID